MLERLTSSRAWLPIWQGRTDEEGQLEILLPKNVRLQPGTYRVASISQPASPLNTVSFYPEVAITFILRDVAQHHHIPLLLGPFGYTTYRGS